MARRRRRRRDGTAGAWVSKRALAVTCFLVAACLLRCAGGAGADAGKTVPPELSEEASALARAGYQAVASGARESALESFAAALALDPACVEALAGRGTLAAMDRDLDAAAIDLAAAAAAAETRGLGLPDRLDLGLRRVQVEFARGDYEATIGVAAAVEDALLGGRLTDDDAMVEAIAGAPIAPSHLIPLLGLRGRAESATGRHRDAVHTLRLATRIGHVGSDPMQAMGESLAALGFHFQALRVFGRMLKAAEAATAGGSDAKAAAAAMVACTAHLGRARSLAELANSDAALEALATAAEVCDDATDARPYHLEGLLRHGMGDLDGAELALSACLERDPNRTVCRRLRGLAREARGSWRAALEDFEALAGAGADGETGETGEAVAAGGDLEAAVHGQESS